MVGRQVAVEAAGISGEPVDQLGDHLTLAAHDRNPLVGEHHEVCRDRLEDGRLRAYLVGDHEVRVVPGQRSVAVSAPRRLLDGADEAADEATGHVLQHGEVGAAAVVPVGDDARREQPVEPGGEVGLVEVRRVGVPRHGEGDFDLGSGVQETRVDAAGRDGILDVVDGVGDVVGPVHHLGFEAPHRRRHPGPEPLEDRQVVGIHTEFGRLPR